MGGHQSQLPWLPAQGQTFLGWDRAPPAWASSLQPNPSWDCVPLGRARTRTGSLQGIWFPKCSMTASALYHEQENGSSRFTSYPHTYAAELDTNIATGPTSPSVGSTAGAAPSRVKIAKLHQQRIRVETNFVLLPVGYFLHMMILYAQRKTCSCLLCSWRSSMSWVIFKGPFVIELTEANAEVSGGG